MKVAVDVLKELEALMPSAAGQEKPRDTEHRYVLHVIWKLKRIAIVVESHGSFSIFWTSLQSWLATYHIFLIRLHCALILVFCSINLRCSEARNLGSESACTCGSICGWPAGILLCLKLSSTLQVTSCQFIAPCWMLRDAKMKVGWFLFPNKHLLLCWGQDQKKETKPEPRPRERQRARPRS